MGQNVVGEADRVVVFVGLVLCSIAEYWVCELVVSELVGILEKRQTHFCFFGWSGIGVFFASFCQFFVLTGKFWG